MSPDFKQCQDSALKLPVEERAALVERLIQSLDCLNDAESERLWAMEAERRYQAYKQGRLSARPADEAIREVRARIR